MSKNCKQTISEEDKHIVAILAEISSYSKIILEAIDALKTNIDKATKKEEINELMETTFSDINDVVKRLNEDKDIPVPTFEDLHDIVPKVRIALADALKVAKNPPKKQVDNTPDITIEWFNTLKEEFKKVHSLSGKEHLLLTFNETILHDREPGYAIKIHEDLQRYLLYKEDRDEVIKEINSRDHLNAIVDEKNDILYVTGSGYQKYNGLGYLLGIFLLGLSIPIIMDSLGYITDIIKQYYIYYILCWVGFSIHILVKNKDIRKENTCLGDIILWIHIKRVNFAMSAVAVVAGYTFLLNADLLNLASSIAAGFAVDSFGSRILHQYYSDLETAVETLPKT